jgi:hypothetical protein
LLWKVEGDAIAVGGTETALKTAVEWGATEARIEPNTRKRVGRWKDKTQGDDVAAMQRHGAEGLVVL